MRIDVVSKTFNSEGKLVFKIKKKLKEEGGKKKVPLWNLLLLLTSFSIFYLNLLMQKIYKDLWQVPYTLIGY